MRTRDKSTKELSGMMRNGIIQLHDPDSNGALSVGDHLLIVVRTNRAIQSARTGIKIGEYEKVIGRGIVMLNNESKKKCVVKLQVSPIARSMGRLMPKKRSVGYREYSGTFKGTGRKRTVKETEVILKPILE